MKVIPMIRKATGESQPFSSKKFKDSLKRSGASESIIESIAVEIEKWLVEESKKALELDREYKGVPSSAIYKKAFSMLRKLTVSSAARYKLKNAMMEMGPTGYPFEHFTGEIFKALGYSVEISKILQGRCVTHEVDVIATKGNHQIFIECKYYSSSGKNANVQVPLYIHSRVNDIITHRKKEAKYRDFTFSGGVVTNTRFTTDAEDYGSCSGLHLLSWDYPKGIGLKDIIDRAKLFPITSLTQITKGHKSKLMNSGIVTCSQLLDNRAAINSLELTDKRLYKVMEELRDLCE